MSFMATVTMGTATAAADVTVVAEVIIATAEAAAKMAFVKTTADVETAFDMPKFVLIVAIMSMELVTLIAMAAAAATMKFAVAMHAAVDMAKTTTVTLGREILAACTIIAAQH